MAAAPDAESCGPRQPARTVPWGWSTPTPPWPGGPKSGGRRPAGESIPGLTSASCGLGSPAIHQRHTRGAAVTRFTTAAASTPELRLPARQDLTPPGHADTAQLLPPEPVSASSPAGRSLLAVEADRVVPPSGNLQLGGQQVWLGPALAGRTVTIWVDETSLHVLLDGTRLKTLPSRLGVTELARLAADGARPAGPTPLPAGNGTAIEVERMVNATGLAGLAGAQVSVGFELAPSGSRCGWKAPRWPSSARTGRCCARCPARSRHTSGNGYAAPAVRASARRPRPGP